MKTTHHTARAIGETNGRFRWGRGLPGHGVIAYRLCLRSEVSRRWYTVTARFSSGDLRTDIAMALRYARRDLRDVVLADDLAALDSAGGAA